jgi:hypothetical protein
MSEFHIDYAMVQSVLKKVKSINPELIHNDELVRELTYMVDRVRREAQATSYPLPIVGRD